MADGPAASTATADVSPHADFEQVGAVADAVLYEGYLLYPYRRSSAKNRVRWQFGVLFPRDWVEADGPVTPTVSGSADSWYQRTECLARIRRPDATVRVRLRYLQMQRKQVQETGPDGYRDVPSLRTADGTVHLTFDEAVPREAEVTLRLDERAHHGTTVPVGAPGGTDVEPLPGDAGRVVRVREELRGSVTVTAERLAPDLVRLQVRTTHTGLAPAPRTARDEALSGAFIATHTLIGGDGVEFVSLIDPPAALRDQVRACRNEFTFPVLGRVRKVPPAVRRPARTLAAPDGHPRTTSTREPVRHAESTHRTPLGPPSGRTTQLYGHDLGGVSSLGGDPPTARVLLSAPIILPDHPQVAPESPGDLHDAAEIDEILTLRTMLLTDEEKREARATDPRAAAILDRVDTMPPEVFARLHGAVRSLTPARPAAPPGEHPAAPPGERPAWWQEGGDDGPATATDTVLVDGVPLGGGSRVRLSPRARGADAQDMFLAGRTAEVAAVFHDVDGSVHLAVTLDDDPASELHTWYGRFHYFRPDELEPLEPAREPAPSDTPAAEA